MPVLLVILAWFIVVSFTFYVFLVCKYITRKDPENDIEVVEDKLSPGDFRVEIINYRGDGEIYIAIFVGIDAEKRANDYAEWCMNHNI